MARRISAPAPSEKTSGKNAHDEGEGGHQDGPKTKPRRLDRGGQGFPALGFQLSGELDDKDRVLAGEACQHKEADLCEDVVVPLADPDAADRGEQAHGHNQDHARGRKQALVFRCQNQVDKEDADREDNQGGIAGQDLLVG